MLRAQEPPDLQSVYVLFLSIAEAGGWTSPGTIIHLPIVLFNWVNNISGDVIILSTLRCKLGTSMGSDCPVVTSTF